MSECFELEAAAGLQKRYLSVFAMYKRRSILRSGSDERNARVRVG